MNTQLTVLAYAALSVAGAEMVYCFIGIVRKIHQATKTAAKQAA